MIGDPVRVETLFDEVAHARPDHRALIWGDRCWTYQQVRAESERRAAVLVEEGLQPGGVVATAERITDDLVVSFLACCRADLALLCLPPLLSQPELVALCRAAAPGLALTATGEPHPALLAPRSLALSLPGRPDKAAAAEVPRRSREGSPDAPAVIRPTSGTTASLPRLAIKPHSQFTYLAMLAEGWPGPTDVCCYSMVNTFLGIFMCHTLFAGATLVISHAVDPARLEAEMADRGATALFAVPALLGLLAGQENPAPPGLHLKAVQTTSAPLSPAVKKAVERRYGAAVVQVFGTSETGHAFATSAQTPEGSIGVPYPGVAVRLLDERGQDVPERETGRLALRVPGMMPGYLNDPEATAAVMRDGWVLTGDLARRDASGFYFLEGRQSLQINVGGFKVTPEEVEGVLAAHPGVLDVAVTGARDAARGEVVRAVIVPRGDPPSTVELRRFCRERLARYKVPRQFEFREEIPRSALGKVLRQKL